MKSPPITTRLRRLTGQQWLALAEAMVILPAASAMIRLMPFRKIMAIAARCSSSHREASPSEESIRDSIWAIEALAARVPWRAVCFQQGLALHLMLRRRGVASRVHYGVRQDPVEGLVAHVWVSVDHLIVLGGGTAPLFAELATFPDAV